MPFNYLSTVIITEADTQPEDAETRGRTQANGKRKGAATGGDGGTGGRPKLAALKSHRMWSYKFPCFQII